MQWMTHQYIKNTQIICTEKAQQFTGQSILWSSPLTYEDNSLDSQFIVTRFPQPHTLFTGFPQSRTHKNNHSLDIQLQGFLNPWKLSSPTDIRQYLFWKFCPESSRLSLCQHALACEEDVAAILVCFSCRILIVTFWLAEVIGWLVAWNRLWQKTRSQLLTITPGGPGSPSMPGSPGSPWKEKHTQLSKPALGRNHNSCLFGSVTSSPPPEITVWLMLKSSHWFFQQSW